MALAMFWLEILAAALLFSCLTVAAASRLYQKRHRIAVLATGDLLVLIPLGTILVLTGMLRFGLRSEIRSSPFYSVLFVFFAWLVGHALIYATGILGWPPSEWRSAMKKPADESEDPAPRATDWPARQWRPTRVGAAFVLAAFLSVSTLLVLEAGVRGRMAHVRAEAGALAASVTPPRVPDSQNAAHIYARLIDAFPYEAEEDDPIGRYVVKDEVDKNDQALGQWLQKRSHALETLRRAAAMEHCDFGRDYARPSWDILLPELTHLRNFARVLKLDACYNCRHGGWDRAMADIKAMEKIGVHIGRDPLLISSLVAVAIDAIRIETIEYALNEGAPPGELLGILSNPATSVRAMMKRGMHMEEAFGLATFSVIDIKTMMQMTDSYSSSTYAALTLIGPAFNVFMLEDDIDFYKSYMKKVHHFLVMPHGSIYATEPIPLSKFGKQMDSMLEDGMGIFSGMIAPVLHGAVKRAVQCEATQRSALVAAAIAAHIAAGNDLAALMSGAGEGLDLERLVPAYLTHVPADPFQTEEKMKALVRPDGALVVYSVGKDEKDDGGKEELKSGGDGDVVFELSADIVRTDR